MIQIIKTKDIRYGILFFLLLFSQHKLHSQENKKALVVEPNLSYAIPQFQYYNDSIENGVFEMIQDIDGAQMFIRGGFKSFVADGTWVVSDSNQIVRLITYYQEGEKVFTKLFDSKGGICRFIKYSDVKTKAVYEEWYNNGRLTQYREVTLDGFYRTITFDKNLRRKTLVDVNQEGKTLQIVHFSADGSVLSKETF